MQLLLVALVLTSTLTVGHTIKHIVVLMEENRSFDHLLGWRPGVDGLKPTDCNWVHDSKKVGAKMCVTRNASQVAKCDPDHDFFPTSIKIFGYDQVHAYNYSDPTMCGFVSYENYRGETLEKNNYCEVMEMFTPETLPIMNALGDDFLIMDKFFASLPGPTWPNRLFFLTGSSGGLTETSDPWFRNKEKDNTGRLYPLRTIYDQVSDAGLTWKNYVNDTPWELFIETVAHHPENVVLTEEFFKDCREGTLPNFSFINPRAGVNFTHNYGSSDQHPDHDVALGEQYYKDIYEALRASPQWNDTLFILTYDEHGGFYDHVPTPLNVPAPDDYTSWPDRFDFRRGGIRIPTLLISPWIPKNVTEGRPPQKSKPTSNSQYELTSIMATVRKILNITEGPLTKRDAWAATFEHLLSEKEPRTDCPVHLPAPIPPTRDLSEEVALPLNTLQKHIGAVHGNLTGKPIPPGMKQGEISGWMQERFAEHKTKIGMWKSSKPGAISQKYEIRCEPLIAMSPAFLTSNWSVTEGSELKYRTVHARVAPNKTATPEEYCMDAGNATEGEEVHLSLCYNTDPKLNRDRDQLWHFTNDATLRPHDNSTLCVTNNCLKNTPSRLTSKITLEKCTGSLEQRYAYMGGAPGNKGWSNEGLLAEGDAIWTLVVINKNG